MHESALHDLKIPKALILRRVVFGADTTCKRTKAEEGRCIIANIINNAFVGNSALHPHTPITSVDKKPSESFAFQINRGTHRCAEDCLPGGVNALSRSFNESFCFKGNCHLIRAFWPNAFLVMSKIACQ